MIIQLLKMIMNKNEFIETNKEHLSQSRTFKKICYILAEDIIRYLPPTFSRLSLLNYIKIFNIENQKICIKILNLCIHSSSIMPVYGSSYCPVIEYTIVVETDIFLTFTSSVWIELLLKACQIFISCQSNTCQFCKNTWYITFFHATMSRHFTFYRQHALYYEINITLGFISSFIKKILSKNHVAANLHVTKKNIQFQ